MISIVHPQVRKVDLEFEILRSLIADIPTFYKHKVDELEQRAKEDAEGAADGDYEIYSDVYRQYDSVIEFYSEITNQMRGYILAAIYAFYERNVKEVYKVLGVNRYKVYPKVSFPSCNLSEKDNKKLYDQIDLIRLIRDNQSHGELSGDGEMEKLEDYVARYKGFEMIDNVVIITDNRYLENALERVCDFFHLVFKINAQFAPKRVGGKEEV